MEKDFRLGHWTVRPALNRLQSEAKTVSVEPRVMDLLVYLFKHTGEVVPRDQIIRDVWRGAFVTDQALTYAVTEMRRALGDNAHSPRFVRTVPKRGYQLIGEFSERPLNGSQSLTEPAAGRSAPRSRRLVLVGLAILVLIIGYVFVDQLTTERALRPSLAQLTFGEGLQTQATWSPDGRLVAFAWNRNGNFDLWIQALDGGEPIRLTDHPSHDTQPSWSPDGRELVFRSERDGGGLFIMPAFGGAVRRICPFGRRPAWSPDGRRILFVSSMAPVIDKRRVYLIDRDGGLPRQIAGEVGTFDACWHPSGRYVFVWGIHLETMVPGSYLAPISGGPLLFSDWRPMAGQMLVPERELNISSIRWAPTGDGIYFEAASEGVSNLWRVKVEPKGFKWGSQPERLTRGANLDTELAVSPSGQRLAFTAETRQSRAWVYPFDTVEGRVTGESQLVSRSELKVLASEFSPQGDRLLLIGAKAATLNVSYDREMWQLPLADPRSASLIDRGLLSSPCWSRDGKFFVYRKVKVYDEQGHRLTWGEHRIVLQPAGGGSKRILLETKERHFGPEDWLRNGNWLICSTHDRPETEASPQLIKLLATDGSQRSSAALLSHPDYDLLSPRLSPDERWICFAAFSRKNRQTSQLYLAPALGRGDWTALIPEENNVDQVHWSPDGRLVYCLARREANTVLLAVPVDSQSGRQRGAAREVLSLDQFACLPEDTAAVRETPTVGFCLAPGHLVVQKIERTGNIWMTTTRRE